MRRGEGFVHLPAFRTEFWFRNSFAADEPIFVSFCVLLTSLRTLAAMICAFFSLGVLSLLHERPTFEKVCIQKKTKTTVTIFLNSDLGCCTYRLRDRRPSVWNDDHGRHFIYHRYEGGEGWRRAKDEDKDDI